MPKKETAKEEKKEKKTGAKRGPKKTYENPEDLRAAVDNYFADCEERGIFPDYAGMKLFIGIVSDTTIERYQTGDDAFGEACREIFSEAAAKRESWLVRKMTSDNKAAQGCLNALKQPRNGGYIDRPQNDGGGEMKLTINVAGVGGESAFK